MNHHVQSQIAQVPVFKKYFFLLFRINYFSSHRKAKLSRKTARLTKNIKPVASYFLGHLAIFLHFFTPL